MKEEAVGCARLPLSRPPSPRLRSGAGGAEGSRCPRRSSGAVPAANRTPSSVRFPPGRRGIYSRWDRWLQPRAPGPARDLVLPGAPGRRWAPWDRACPVPGHLGSSPRGSLFPPRGEGARLGRARRGAPPRLPSGSCVLCPTGCSFPSGASACPLQGPGSAAGAAWRLSCSCGPTRGRRRGSRANTLLGRRGDFWGDVGLSPAGGGGPCAAPRCCLRRSTRAVEAGGGVGRGSPRPIKGRGGAERGELFPAGAERRPAEVGPFPPAPVGKHLLPRPRRQPRSSPSPDPKPLRSGGETLLPLNLRGTGSPAGRTAALPGAPAGVRSQREASLLASPEAAPE